MKDNEACGEERKKTKNGHNHGEAFNIMIYECDTCGGKEKIWNSRDGVTPFATSCPVDGCEGTAQHKDWNADEHAPDYNPPIGSRIWIDMTPEKALEYATKQVEGSAENRDITFEEGEKGELIESLAKSYIEEGRRDLLGDGELIEGAGFPPDIAVVEPSAKFTPEEIALLKNNKFEEFTDEELKLVEEDNLDGKLNYKVEKVLKKILAEQKKQQKDYIARLTTPAPRGELYQTFLTIDDFNKTVRKLQSQIALFDYILTQKGIITPADVELAIAEMTVKRNGALCTACSKINKEEMDGTYKGPLEKDHRHTLACDASGIDGDYELAYEVYNVIGEKNEHANIICKCSKFEQRKLTGEEAKGVADGLMGK